MPCAYFVTADVVQYRLFHKDAAKCNLLIYLVLIRVFFPLDDPVTVSTSSPSPSLVVISRPSVNFTPQAVSIDLSKNTNAVPLSSLSNGTGNITIFNIDESQTSLNLSTESSGYVSNSTTSSLGNISLNQSAVNGDELELDGKGVSAATLIVDQRIPLHSQSTFSALPMPPSTSSAGRRRTISSNSNR